jgi:hypothetical protein
MATFRFRSNRWQARVRQLGRPDETRSFLIAALIGHVDSFFIDEKFTVHARRPSACALPNAPHLIVQGRLQRRSPVHQRFAAGS